MFIYSQRGPKLYIHENENGKVLPEKFENYESLQDSLQQ